MLDSPVIEEGFYHHAAAKRGGDSKAGSIKIIVKQGKIPFERRNEIKYTYLLRYLFIIITFITLGTLRYCNNREFILAD